MASSFVSFMEPARIKKVYCEAQEKEVGESGAHSMEHPPDSPTIIPAPTFPG
jgi:hypothetical protein